MLLQFSSQPFLCGDTQLPWGRSFGDPICIDVHAAGIRTRGLAARELVEHSRRRGVGIVVWLPRNPWIHLSS